MGFLSKIINMLGTFLLLYTMHVHVHQRKKAKCFLNLFPFAIVTFISNFFHTNYNISIKFAYMLCEASAFHSLLSHCTWSVSTWIRAISRWHSTELQSRGHKFTINQSINSLVPSFTVLGQNIITLVITTHSHAKYIYNNHCSLNHDTLSFRMIFMCLFDINWRYFIVLWKENTDMNVSGTVTFAVTVLLPMPKDAFKPFSCVGWRGNAIG